MERKLRSKLPFSKVIHKEITALTTILVEEHHMSNLWP